MNDNTVSILGLTIELNRPADGQCECGSMAAVIRPGSGPHRARLDCAYCGKFRGWLPALAADALVDTVERYGGWPDVFVQPRSPEFDFEGERKITQPKIEGKAMAKISETFPSRFLKAADLQGEDRKVVIQGVMIEKLGVGPDANEKPVVTYRGWVKVHPLGKVVSKFVADALGDDTDTWIGKHVIVYEATESFQGKPHQVVKIRMPTARDKMPVSTSMPPPSDDDGEPPFDV
jgi:hypothetical protein